MNTFTCDICRKSFKFKSGMIAHRRFHTGEKIFECDICKKKFTQKADLVKHKRIHTGKKPHECDICDKSFNEKSSLANHKRIHTGEKPYACMLCLKSFSYNCSLSLHYKSDIHLNKIKSNNLNSSGNKNLVIDCGKSIKLKEIKEEINWEGRGTESSYKTNSYITNTIHKQHSCDICGKLFSDKSMLDIHKYIHVGEKHKVVEDVAMVFIKEEIKEEMYEDYVEEKEVNKDDFDCDKVIKDEIKEECIDIKEEKENS